MGGLKYIDHNITEIPSHEVPEFVPIIPLRNAVVFPGILLPIFVGRLESIRLIEEHAPGALIGVFTQRDPEQEKVRKDDLHPIGSLVEIHRIIPMSEGGYQVFLQGVQKIELIEIVSEEPYLKAKIRPIYEDKNYTEADVIEFQTYVIRYIENNPSIPDDATNYIRRIHNPSALANQVIFFSNLSNEEKINFLKIGSVKEKLEEAKKYLLDETQRLIMEKEVREKVEKDAAKLQREFYLRKQLETIRKELGEIDSSDVEELEKRIVEKKLPDHVRKAVDKEFKRYKRLMESPHGTNLEATQIRNWLELVLDLPWNVEEEREKLQEELKQIDLEKAQKILDEDHEGLEEVKKRILEYLAVEKKAKNLHAPILCFIGPPGVGKTSLGKSIAKCMNRPLVRASLGGVRDEAEIRGHRRTYVGAMPGKIISSMKKAETIAPVFLLDEIDKISYSFHGDPAAALLEVLDPEQNHTFEDHYLGLPYDLSKVVFIATANTIDTIPAPLLDRMEIVTLSGYTTSEKIRIAKNHLIPNARRTYQLTENEWLITDEALEKIVEGYTREAGVRNLKRQIESIARKVVLKIEKEKDLALPVVVDVNDLVEYLGKERYYKDHKEHIRIPGVAIGLAWTPVGGDILYIETTKFPGKGNLKLSGRLGDVMKESAHLAFSFLRAHANELNIQNSLFHDYDFHIHVPSGAVPKDGPSAGITILVSLASLLTNTPIDQDLAMTGEISLRGKVLPVGGIKEKVIAAKSAGISTVILPDKNRADFEEIPEYIRSGIQVEYYSDMMDVLRRVLPQVFQKPKFTDREGW
ncbi:MAG: endopeptidase La [Leptospiraceae bacterium]|nr:endopeptidase La [Leptospiraceae bacterium]MDW7976782.1 endopeptidase La [Leptospiraceae bacterium]